MRIENESVAMIEMFAYPVFCVQDGIITDRNHYAEKRQITTGTPIVDLILDGVEEYKHFHDGCLSLNLQICNIRFIATVLHTQDKDVFHLQSEYNCPEFRTMALIAQQLRQPLADVMCLTSNLFSDTAIRATSKTRSQVAQINRGLLNLLRQLSNLSAVSSFSKERLYSKETRNVTAIFDELFDRAQVFISQTGRILNYTSLNESVYSFVDVEMLERSVWNLLSNAVKFSPCDSKIIAKLLRNGNKLYFSIESQVDHVHTESQHSFFFRFVRDAEIEDGRNGIGLGIPLAQYTAAAHNGTLLMDHPRQDTIRFTLTLQIQQGNASSLSPIFHTDYLGGYDHCLVELSDVLPSSAYEDIN